MLPVAAEAAATATRFWFAGPDGPDAEPAFPVDRVRVVVGGLLVREPAGLPPELRTVWAADAAPGSVLRALYAGLRAAGPAPLAASLARRVLSGAPDAAIPAPRGLTDEQAQAYRACLTPGLRLVWGPPGPSTSAVLAAAAGTLLAEGRRVLLLATSDAEVDTALLGITGSAVRIGPPRLPEIADDPAVALDLVACQASADLDRRREAIAQRLGTIAGRGPLLTALASALAGYDDDAYRGAASRIAAARELAELESRRAAAAAVTRAARAEHERASTVLTETQRAVAASGAARAALERIDVLTDELRLLDRDLARHRNALAVARTWAGGGVGWLDVRRRQRKVQAAAADLARAERDAGPVRSRLMWELMEARSTAGHLTRDAVLAQEAALTQARAAVADAHAALERAEDYMEELLGLTAAAQTRGTPTAVDRTIVARAEQDDLPALHEQLGRLRRQQTATTADRERLVAEHRALCTRTVDVRGRRAAAAVAEAGLVATTLARSHTSPELVGQVFDAVLVAGAGTAPVAEVLLALTHARTTAVLFGDVLAPVRGPFSDTDPAVATWLGGTAFSHAGLDAADEAVAAQGCVTLLHEFRAARAVVGRG